MRTKAQQTSRLTAPMVTEPVLTVPEGAVAELAPESVGREIPV